MQIKSQSITRGALILGAASFLSYLLGLFRDRLLASTFGAGTALDAYNTAFIIPDVIANLLFAGVSLSVLMPVLTDIAARKKNAEAFRVANTVLNLTAIVLTILSVIVFFLMPVLIKLVAPGFTGEQRTLTVELSRLMLLSPLLFALSNAFGSILVSMKRFASYAFSPVFYNIGIVAGLLIFSKKFGIHAAVIGTIAGAFLHLLFRFVELIRTPYRYSPILDLKHPALRKIGTMMIPRMINLMAVQANLWAWNAIASTLAVGSIAVFNLSRNLQSLPVSLFGIALATAVSPTLTDTASTNNWPKFVEHIRRTFSRILFFTLPAGVGMFLLRYEIADVLFSGGQFTDANMRATAFTLGVFCLVTPLESVVHLLLRAFYAQLDTKTPLLISLAMTATNIISALVFTKWIGVAGLPLGFAVANALQLTLLLLVLHKRVQGFNIASFITTTRTSVIATLAMSATLSIYLWWFRSAFTAGTLTGIIQIGSGVLIGAFVYFLTSNALRDENTNIVRAWFTRLGGLTKRS
ncbi:MAG: murein biosynthesis integral membrane protein MurJ [Patescibacteria group bacterium]